MHRPDDRDDAPVLKLSEHIPCKLMPSVELLYTALSFKSGVWYKSQEGNKILLSVKSVHCNVFRLFTHCTVCSTYLLIRIVWSLLRLAYLQRTCFRIRETVNS